MGVKHQQFWESGCPDSHLFYTLLYNIITQKYIDTKHTAVLSSAEMPVCYTKKTPEGVKKTEISHKMWLNSPNWPGNVQISTDIN